VYSCTSHNSYAGSDLNCLQQLQLNTSNKKHVGIAEEKKVGKRGRDDNIKQGLQVI